MEWPRGAITVSVDDIMQFIEVFHIRISFFYAFSFLDLYLAFRDALGACRVAISCCILDHSFTLALREDASFACGKISTY
ncbi:predicted protein [Plenodomus lingam JN3]|uniref:Predicted protein n=1 Tax=Leptosphaeria maculans (strain JN3 / isolate v23.1.3 / race Av1-4-5-6-7-8) TaxID=985895 RepID=E5A0Y7_LEPMJ|nr:predicted protein [Plenodomus lingam JN3]CBX97283.1 predicted protein [Plenodomus lingam JN3]